MNMAQQLREKLGVNSKKTPGLIDFKIEYAHTDEHVMAMFGHKIDNLTMTVEQLDEMVKVLGEVRAALLKHQKEKANG